MKKVLVVMLFLGMFAFAHTGETQAASSLCSKYIGQSKIWWDGAELKSGQIGRLTVVKNTSLFKLEGNKRTFERTLKAGENYRIYAFKPGMLSVGGGFYIDRNEKVKYETPSKTKLEAVKCIQGFAKDPTRGIPANASYNFVKSKEKAYLLHTFSERDISVLIYEIPNKFDTYSYLTYYFKNGKLLYLVYDFMPDHDSYDSFSGMGSIFHYYLKGIESELGTKYDYYDNGYNSYFANWDNKNWTAMFAVDDKNLYTSALLIVTPK